MRSELRRGIRAPAPRMQSVPDERAHDREVEMLDSLKTPLVLVGRILIAFMFMQSGYGKLMDLSGTAGYTASGGLPNSTALARLTGVFELVAGLAILVGFKGRWAALVLAALTVVASFLYHAYWGVPADQQMTVQLLFM